MAESTDAPTGSASESHRRRRSLDGHALPSADKEDAVATSRLLWTLDLTILLPLTLLYFLCYLDRSNLANAKSEVSAAMGLSSTQYGLASSLFQVGYICCEVPANIVLKRSRPSLWLGFLVVAFGLVATSTAFAGSFEELVAVRVCLGIAEAGFPVGVLYYLSMYYRPGELGKRNAIFLVAGPLANACGALIAYGVLQLDAGGLVGWQWLFVLEGAPAVALGAAAMLYLPDHPSRCRWLTPAQKALAAARVPMHAESSAEHAAVNWADIGSLLASPILWSFALLNVCTNVASYGIGAFLPAIIGDMGYSALNANLLTAPVYLCMAAFNLGAAALSDRTGERGHVIVGCLAVCAAGMFGLAAGTARDWPLAAQYALLFATIFYSATSPIMIAWLQRAYRGSSDAAVGPAAVLTIGSLGAFLGPNIYGATAGNVSFFAGHLAMGCVFAAGAALAAGMRAAFAERDGRLVLRSSWPRPCPCARGKGSERTMLLGGGSGVAVDLESHGLKGAGYG